MRKLNLWDLLATLITAAVVVPFAGNSVRGSMPLVQDTGGSKDPDPPQRAPDRERR
jgi:hypothetical protein